MRQILILLLLAASVPAVKGQAATADTIATHQAEIIRLGQTFYHINLQDAGWTQHEVSPCPAFSHYVFAEFDHTSPSGEDLRFLAIYRLNHPPAKSSAHPWEGGAQLIPLDAHLPNKENLGYDEQTRVNLFNHILTDEEKIGGKINPPLGMTQSELAECFVRFSGENARKAPPNPELPPEDKAAQKLHFDDVLIPLDGPGTLARAQYIRFDKQGLIVEATVKVQKVY